MLRRITLLLCLLVLAAPTAALAQDQSPFTPLPPAQTSAPEPATTDSSSSGSSDGGGLRTWQEILIFVGGGILLLGIAWAIVSDARQAAPTGDEREGVTQAKALREADHKRRKQKARQAGKRARAARRRNR
jgi:hypothetical protein